MKLENMTIEQLEKIKEILVIVDMVNGFTTEGSMKNIYMQKIIPEVLRLTKEFENDDEALIIEAKEAHDDESVEFDDYPKHCKKGDSEALLVPELRVYEHKMFVFEKNSTCVAILPEYIELLTKLKNLKRAVFVGGCTDICGIQAIIPTKCLFNQLNRRVEVIVPENAMDTYDAPWHNRDEYNDIAYKLMKQGGIQLVKKYERGMNYGK